MKASRKEDCSAPLGSGRQGSPSSQRMRWVATAQARERGKPAAQSRLENWIRWLLLANWLVVFVGPPIMMFWPQLAFLWLVWILTIPVPAILLVVLFKRDQRRAA